MVTLATLQQTGKLSKQGATEIPQQEEGPEPQLSSSKKEENSQWVSATIRIEIQQEPLHLLWLEGEDSETGRRMASGWRSTGSLDCFPSKWADSISAFSTDSQARPLPAPIRGGRDESELNPNTPDFKVNHHLWGHWACFYFQSDKIYHDHELFLCH